MSVHRKFGSNPLPIELVFCFPNFQNTMNTNCLVELMILCGVDVVLLRPKLHINILLVEWPVWRMVLKTTSNNLELDNLKRLAAGIINRDSCQLGYAKYRHTTHTHTHSFTRTRHPYTGPTHSRSTLDALIQINKMLLQCF